MRTAFSYRPQWMSYAILVSSALSVLINTRAIGGPMATPDHKQASEHAADLVDQLANCNKPPRRVKLGGHSVPVFPESYDWDEDRRVFKALQALWADTSDELWDELVRRDELWDQIYEKTGSFPSPYCLTIRLKADGSGQHMYVNSFCGALAGERLLNIVWRNLPPEPTKNGPLKVRGNLILASNPPSPWAKWRRERPNKKFYELQIEVCEHYLCALAKEENIPDEDKEISRKNVEAEIAKMRRTKKPIIPKFNFAEEYSLYTPQQAKEIREKLKLER
jgi:hypothetical protein